MATDDEYRRLAAEHSDHARKLDQLEALPHLSMEEEMEEHRLKKMKLRLKDQMEADREPFPVTPGRLDHQVRCCSCKMIRARSGHPDRAF